MEKILLVIVAVLGIAAAQVIGPRIRVAPPLLLVIGGALVGILPMVPAITLDPEWILIGVLPPLLYSAAVSMPTMDFRRDLSAISALSVLLVLISSIALGFFFAWVLPGMSIATGIALGAIVSPTDAVATSIAKRLGVPGRVIAMLEGESLLNDATALVLLRAAVAATAAGLSFGHVALGFVWAVVGAVLIGGLIGWLNLTVRRRIPDATVNTAISFTVPYLAYLPAEELGASGLVAAVTAGLITGAGAARFLSPQHRLSDAQNWHTVELLAEGGVFLLMGLELFGLLKAVHDEHGGVPTALWVGLAALALALLVRALYVAPLVWWLDRVARRGSRMRPYLEDMGAHISEKEAKLADAGIEVTGDEPPPRRLRLRPRSGRKKRNQLPVEQLSTEAFVANPAAVQHYQDRITRRIADIDYFASAPIGPKEGTILVWAGMRGVVTLAAAQTLPHDTPSRALLVLIAFIVAAASLIGQGGTLGSLIRALRLTDNSDEIAAERNRLHAELTRISNDVLAGSDVAARYPWVRERIDRQTREAESDEAADRNLAYRKAFEEVRRAMLDAQRDALLEMRATGNFHSSLLTAELRQLDAEQISLDLRDDES